MRFNTTDKENKGKKGKTKKHSKVSEGTDLKGKDSKGPVVLPANLTFFKNILSLDAGAHETMHRYVAKEKTAITSCLAPVFEGALSSRLLFCPCLCVCVCVCVCVKVICWCLQY